MQGPLEYPIVTFGVDWTQRTNSALTRFRAYSSSAS